MGQKAWKFTFDLKNFTGEFHGVPDKKTIKEVEKALGIKIHKKKKVKK